MRGLSFLEAVMARNDMTDEEADRLFGDEAAPETEADDFEEGDGNEAPVDTVAVVIGAGEDKGGEEAAPESSAGSDSAPTDDRESALAAREAALAEQEQRLKSWEGRLKASEKPAEAAAPTEPAPMNEDAEAAARMLAEDLGSEELVVAMRKLIRAEATVIAQELVSGGVGELRDGVSSLYNAMHNDGVEDAMELTGVSKDDLVAYVASLPEESKQKAESIMSSGTAFKVRRLLKLAGDWKKEQAAAASAAPAEATEEPAAAPADEEDPFNMPDADEAIVSQAAIRLPGSGGAGDDAAAIEAIWAEEED